MIDANANVTVTNKSKKSKQTVLRALISVLTALLGGTNVFLSYSSAGVPLVFFKPCGKTNIWGLGGTSDKTMETCWLFQPKYKILYQRAPNIF